MNPDGSNPQPNQEPTPTPTPTPEVAPTTPEAVPTPAATTPEVTPVEAVPTKKKFPKWAIILISTIGGLLVLGAIAIVILISVLGSTLAKPLSVSNQFVDAVQANDASAAYALTSDSFKKATPESSLESIISRVGPLLAGDEKLTNQSVKAVNGVNNAEFDYTVENDGKTLYMVVKLQENNGEWQVYSFQSDDAPISSN